MNLRLWTRGTLALFAATLLLVGCAQGDKEGQAKNKDTQGGAKNKTKHDDWWCKEHGIPEEECSMCSKEAAKAFKDKGDWCKEHKRAASQCFICNPNQYEVYAAKHRAKYGTEPPPPEDNMPSKKDDPKKDDPKKDEPKKDDLPK